MAAERKDLWHTVNKEWVPVGLGVAGAGAAVEGFKDVVTQVNKFATEPNFGNLPWAGGLIVLLGLGLYPAIKELLYPAAKEG